MAILGAALTDELNKTAAEDFSPVPAGEYIVRVVKADLAQTKDGTGQMVKVEFDILAPAYQGRKLFARFNLRNRSPKAEQIGKSQFKALYLAGNVPEPVIDTDQLLGITVKATVTVREAHDGYGPSNDVRGYKALAPANDAIPQPAMPPAGGTFSQAFARPAATAAAPGNFKW